MIDPFSLLRESPACFAAVVFEGGPFRVVVGLGEFGGGEFGAGREFLDAGQFEFGAARERKRMISPERGPSKIAGRRFFASSSEMTFITKVWQRSRAQQVPGERRVRFQTWGAFSNRRQNTPHPNPPLRGEREAAAFRLH